MCRNKSVSHLHECRLSSEICNGRYISIGIDIRCTVNWWLFKWQYKSIYAGQHNWSNNSTGQCTQWRSVLVKVTRKTYLKPHVNIEVSWRQCEQVVWCLVCWFRNTSIVQISYTYVVLLGVMQTRSPSLPSAHNLARLLLPIDVPNYYFSCSRHKLIEKTVK